MSKPFGLLALLLCLTYTKAIIDTLELGFEIAPPGQPEAFSTHIKAIARQRNLLESRRRERCFCGESHEVKNDHRQPESDSAS